MSLVIATLMMKMNGTLTSPSRAWLRLNALQVLSCFLAC